MSIVNIRQAVSSDLDALAPLFDCYRQFYGRSSNISAAREFLVARFSRGESVLLIAHEEDSAAGFVQLYPSFSSVSLSRIFILNDIFVSDHCRKKGIGSLLIKTAIEYVRAHGAALYHCQRRSRIGPPNRCTNRTGWARDDQFLYYHFPLENQRNDPSDLTR